MKLLKYSFIKCFLSSIVLLIIFLINCPVADNDKSGGGDNKKTSSLEAPGNITASVEDENINVSWDPVDGADSYQLYIQLEDLGFVPIDEALIADGGTEYVDTDAPDDQNVSYTVRALCGVIISPLSTSTECTSLYVLDLEISKLESDSKISLNWKEHDSASGYNIYRYESKNDVPVLLEENYSDTEYEDTLCDPDKPYFYQVTWLEAGIEKGTDCSLYLGIMGSQIDYNESNDLLSDSSGPLIHGDSYISMMYSFANKDDDVFADTDFYYYEYQDDPQTVTVYVTLPVDTSFNNGEVKFRFYNNGSIASDEYSVNKGPKGMNVFVFDDFNSGDTDIYFKVYTDIDSSRSVIGSYEVVLEEGF